jgi:hypothetical protein
MILHICQKLNELFFAEGFKESFEIVFGEVQGGRPILAVFIKLPLLGLLATVFHASRPCSLSFLSFHREEEKIISSSRAEQSRAEQGRGRGGGRVNPKIGKAESKDRGARKSWVQILPKHT